MFSTETLMTLAPGLPLLAAVVTALFGRKLGRHAHWPALVCVAMAFLCSVDLLHDVYVDAIGVSREAIGYEKVHTLYRWVGIENALGNADFAIDVTLRLDPLTAIMLSMVTFISTLVVLYSIGYMHGDPGYARFFATVALFVFSMTMLVSVSNFILLYVFWEAVGACSYLLIGFWFQKPEAAAAGKKAFLVNRVGDFGFAIALFLIWTSYGTLNFHDTTHQILSSVAASDTRAAPWESSNQIPTSPGDSEATVRNLHAVHEYRPSATSGYQEQLTRGVLGQSRIQQKLFIGGAIGTAICLLLMLGACGKSAQFPLHVWLPDAMEGPTPVSALIHAATMVTAGVYMVTRCMPLFMASEDARLVVSTIGAVTALLAGLIALTQTDLKRVLAYSTVSQLGYMFLALGTGSLAGAFAGMFHLFTHAFFKACLFLGAGSVMHAMGGVIDMRRFGGLRKIMPVTHWTFLAGCLALAGFPLLSGFWSKDAILAAVHSAGEEQHWFHYLYYAALGTAFLTAFYTFRAFFMTFYGDERVPHEAGHHAHESPTPMTVPLVILGILALAIGWIAEHPFLEFLRHTPSLASAAIVPDIGGEAGKMHWDIAAVSSVVALLGIGIAAFMYLGERNEADALAKATGRVGLFQLSRDKFYLDEIYTLLVVWPLRIAAAVVYFLDRYLVDGLVNLVGRVPPTVGALVRPLQNGLVQFYALAMLLGVLTLVGLAYWVQS